jgi:bifunctional UDP-N-acetylglucosamine pyrophosphorylase/glucosamine-1-phosphate N-acetyltransferase
VRKHPTTIGDGVFVGSDTMMVAPVNIGEGAVVGAGSVITVDVPAESLAVARSREKIIDGWVNRKQQ